MCIVYVTSVEDVRRCDRRSRCVLQVLWPILQKKRPASARAATWYSPKRTQKYDSVNLDTHSENLQIRQIQCFYILGWNF